MSNDENNNLINNPSKKTSNIDIPSTTSSSKSSSTSSTPSTPSTPSSTPPSTSLTTSSSTSLTTSKSKSNSNDAIINLEISKLIVTLKKLIEIESQLIKGIENPISLISSLCELDSMIGMKSVKESICKQVMFLIERKANSFDNQMLHTVLYGPPGTGKSKLGLILCKIWCAIGCLKIKKTERNDDHDLCPAKILKMLLNENTLQREEKLESANKVINNVGVISDIIISETVNIKKDYKNFRTTIESYIKKNNNLTEELNSIFRRLQQIENLSNSIKKESFNFLGKEPVPDLPESPKRVRGNTSGNISGKSGTGSLPIIIDITDNSSDNINIFESDRKRRKKNFNYEDKKKDDPFIIVSRSDFVAEYLGQTSNKTKALLEASLGKVVFIDEAYSLYNGDRDSYGLEALTTLNQFMSEHPNEITIIFAGYKDMMQESIFTQQPGLQRRCTWVFEIEKYSASDLNEIFLFQSKKDSWILPEDTLEFFKTNYQDFPSFGGDTERLLYYSKLEHSTESFERACEDVNYMPNKNLSLDQIKKGFKVLKLNQAIKREIVEMSVSKHMMYM